MKHQQGNDNKQLSRKSKAVPEYSLSCCFPASLQLLSQGATLLASCTLDRRRGTFYSLASISDSSPLPLLIHPQATIRTTFCPQPGSQQHQRAEPEGTEPEHTQRLEGTQPHPGCLSVPGSSEWTEIREQAPVSFFGARTPLPFTPSFSGCALAQATVLARAPVLPQGTVGQEPSPISVHAAFTTDPPLNGRLISD